MKDLYPISIKMLITASILDGPFQVSGLVLYMFWFLFILLCYYIKMFPPVVMCLILDNKFQVQKL